MQQLPPQADPTKAVLTKEIKHARPLTSCFWEPQSRFVFFGAEDNLVHRVNLRTEQIVPLAGHDSWVRGFAATPDGQTLFTGGYDGRLIAWPLAAETPEPLRVNEAHTGWIRAVAISGDGKLVATCGNDRLIKVWDVNDGRLVQEFAGHQHHVYNVIFLPDSAQLVSCDLKGVVRLWQVGSAESRELATVQQLHGYDTTFRADIGGARSIAISPDGNQVALGGITNVSNAFAGVGEPAIALVNSSTGEVHRVLESKDKAKGTMWGVAHHPDGFWIGVAGGGGGGWLRFWNADGKHEFTGLKLKNDGRGMSLSPDHRQVAVAHADLHLRLYQF